MSTKIRLQRQGRKGNPIFKIVVADSRSKRDGRFIENLGQYNPNTNPATIELNFDSAVSWIMKGAQPTNTARAILSYKGVLMKKHLLGGVAKGAFSEEEADKKFEEWLASKNDSIKSKSDSIAKAAQEEAIKRLNAEKEVNQARAASLAIANSELVEETINEEAPVIIENTEEVAETPAEEVKEEATEAPAEEVKEEAVAETTTEEVKEETTETPTEEVKEEAVAETTTEEVKEETTETPTEEVKEEAVAETPTEEVKEEATEAPAEENKEEAAE